MHPIHLQETTYVTEIFRILSGNVFLLLPDFTFKVQVMLVGLHCVSPLAETLNVKQRQMFWLYVTFSFYLSLSHSGFSADGCMSMLVRPEDTIV